MGSRRQLILVVQKFSALPWRQNEEKKMNTNTDTNKHVRLSRRLSYVLRHNPSSIGVELDPAGWIDVDVLVAQLRTAGKPVAVTAEQISEVVAVNDKKRFELVGGRIRAAQGHSVDVDLGLEPIEPPMVLWHGTVGRFLDSINAKGLVAGNRTHVHLSADIDTARNVGSRRGKPVILRIDAAGMHADGHQFYRSANGVWLVAAVPAKWIRNASR